MSNIEPVQAVNTSDTVTISRKEYEELLKKAEDYQFLIGWKHKRGAQFEKLMFLRDFDRYASNEHKIYRDLKKEYERLQAEHYMKG